MACYGDSFTFFYGSKNVRLETHYMEDCLNDSSIYNFEASTEISTHNIWNNERIT
jgi:hypothetical protein